jgi:hypothetical protein
MRARGWSGGYRNSPVYGIAFSKADRDRNFDRGWRSIVLELGDDRSVIEVQLTDAFWKDCPELRHPEIRQWFTRLSAAPWPAGSPPSFGVSHLEENRFAVRRMPPSRPLL